MNKIEVVKTVERLTKHPHLLERINALLDVTENTSGKLDRADDAEEQLIIEVNKIAIELLQTWAVTQEEKKAKEARDQNKELIIHSKKNYTGNQPLDR